MDTNGDIPEISGGKPAACCYVFKETAWLCEKTSRMFSVLRQSARVPDTHWENRAEYEMSTFAVGVFVRERWGRGLQRRAVLFGSGLG